MVGPSGYVGSTHCHDNAKGGIMREIACSLTWVILLGLAPGLLSCARQREVAAPRSKSEVLDREIAAAEQRTKDKKLKVNQVDDRLRIASMALDAGKPELAREALIDATAFMTACSPEKDFAKRAGKAVQLLGGKEEKKYFIGDPHEQLLAFLLLGILDFQAGDYGKALASFRSASLADAGSREEGYKSDCYLAFLFEGITCRMLEDETGAEEAFRLTTRAFEFRQRMPLLQEALYLAAGAFWPDGESKTRENMKRLDALFPLVVSQLPVALTISPDVKAAVDAAFTGAELLITDRSKKKEALPEAKEAQDAYSKKDIGEAIADLNRLKSLVLEELSEERLDALSAREAEFAAFIESCNATRTNTFVLQQVGKGPSKVRLGKYGQTVQIRSHPCHPQRMLTTIRRVGQADGSPLRVSMGLLGESVDYQAKTRGGREMDSILKGKAQFRDAMNVSSSIAGGVASAAHPLRIIRLAHNSHGSSMLDPDRKQTPWHSNTTATTKTTAATNRIPTGSPPNPLPTWSASSSPCPCWPPIYPGTSVQPSSRRSRRSSSLSSWPS